MDPILVLLLARFDATRQALLARRQADGGYSTEAVVVTGVLVVLALAVIGMIAAKVRAKAASIDLGMGL